MLFDIHEPGASPLPHRGEAEVAVGIDLGTTNSLVAIASDGKATILRGVEGAALLPSTVTYSAAGVIAVGTEKAEEGTLTIRSVKRLLGRKAEEVDRVAGALPFALGAGQSIITIHTPAGEVNPISVSAEILKTLKARAEAALGRNVNKAVITVPAYFDDAARAATKAAATLSGLEVIRLLAEPTAAALAYGLEKGVQGLYAVYDLGGGTFDFSLLHLQDGIFRVLATGGDATLGGDDFDRAIAAHIAAGRIPATASEAARLLLNSRRIKEVLCRTGSCAEMDIGTMNSLVFPFVERSLQVVAGVLADAKVKPEDIKGVVLVGGSTRVPLVKTKVAQMFGRMVLDDIHPEEIVAIGAAIQAEALTAGSSNLLLDVTPLSLGLETMGGIVEKVIWRNTPIPCSATQEFTTYADNQQGMIIHVLQGEREMVEDCRSLARFELKGIPPLPASVARVKVSFTIDADGLLAITAREESTKTVQTVEIHPSFGLSIEEMEEMLRRSFNNAETDMARRMQAEKIMEAKRTLECLKGAVARHGALLAPEMKKEMENTSAALEKAIKEQNIDAVEARNRDLENQASRFAEVIINTGVKASIQGKDVNEVKKIIKG